MTPTGSAGHILRSDTLRIYYVIKETEFQWVWKILLHKYLNGHQKSIWKARVIYIHMWFYTNRFHSFAYPWLRRIPSSNLQKVADICTTLRQTGRLLHYRAVSLCFVIFFSKFRCEFMFWYLAQLKSYVFDLVIKIFICRNRRKNYNRKHKQTYVSLLLENFIHVYNVLWANPLSIPSAPVPSLLPSSLFPLIFVFVCVGGCLNHWTHLVLSVCVWV